MKRSPIAFAGLFLMTLSLQCAAGARDRLDEFTRGLQGLDGKFSQEVFDPNGRRTDQASGTVELSAPRQFRWQYAPPTSQLIVADGQRVWIYDPDLEQVTVRGQGGPGQASPLEILVDPKALDRQFSVVDAGRSGGLEWLELKPRQPDDAPFLQARLGFGPEGLARMELQDALGQRTELAFSDWKRNPVFSPGLFRFSPPDGVDVVGDGN
jgi:outer membrane lipoprotein carrier protein